MFAEQGTDTGSLFLIPDALKTTNSEILPQLTPEILNDLHDYGWSTVGLIATLVAPDGSLLLLQHKGRSKNAPGTWGPLSETSQASDTMIEQPVETLFRGIQEELAIRRPGDLSLWVRPQGWVINKWPRGDQYPGEYGCGISIPIFISEATKQLLELSQPSTAETSGLRFMSRASIKSGEYPLRAGVENWLTQLEDTGLLERSKTERLQYLDLSSAHTAPYINFLRAIDLGKRQRWGNYS